MCVEAPTFDGAVVFFSALVPMAFSSLYPVLWLFGAGVLMTSCQDAPSEAGQVRQRAVPQAPVAPLPVSQARA